MRQKRNVQLNEKASTKSLLQNRMSCQKLAEPQLPFGAFWSRRVEAVGQRPDRGREGKRGPYCQQPERIISCLKEAMLTIRETLSNLCICTVYSGPICISVSSGNSGEDAFEEDADRL